MRLAFTLSTDRRLFIPSRRGCPTGSGSNSVPVSSAHSHLGIGADATSPSRYIRKRGEANCVRPPSAMPFRPPGSDFRPGTMVSTTILTLLRRSDHPMFGRARPDCSRPMWRCAEAIGRTMQLAETPSTIFDYGGRASLLRGVSWAVAHKLACARLIHPVCRLACARMGSKCPQAAPHTQSSGTDAIDTVSSPEVPDLLNLDFAALGRGDTPEDTTNVNEEAPRLFTADGSRALPPISPLMFEMGGQN